MTVDRMVALAACLALASPSRAGQSCGEGLGADMQTLEGKSYVVAYATSPSPVEVGRHFIVDFAVCPRGNDKPAQSVRVDANMPEHRHGMNYRPTVVALEPGRYRGEGLMFHMPGRWDLTFDIARGTSSERIVGTLRIE